MRHQPIALVAVAGLGLALCSRADLVVNPWLAALTPADTRLRPLDVLLEPERDSFLYSQLEAGDRTWTPRVERIPGVGLRYIYKRRDGEPPMDLEQIRRLMQHPPSFAGERQAVAVLLRQLRRTGVRVVLGPPIKRGAAGEWEARRRVLRIRPDIPDKGTHEFVRVLNHEAIHVAQSCRRGDIGARPIPLGLSRLMPATQRRNLNSPIYAMATPQERILEEEAYANQDNLSLGWQLLQVHCRNR